MTLKTQMTNDLAAFFNDDEFAEDIIYTAKTTNLITNGAFDSDTEWSKGTGWSIAAGVASCDGTQAATSHLTQDPPLVIGKTYRCSFTLSNYGAGNVLIMVGNSGLGTWRSANGTYHENIICAGTTTILIAGDADFVGDIDNVECYLISNITIPAIVIRDTPLQEPYVRGSETATCEIIVKISDVATPQFGDTFTLNDSEIWEFDASSGVVYQDDDVLHISLERRLD